MATSTLQMIIDTVKDAAGNIDSQQIQQFSGGKIDSVDQFMAKTDRTAPKNFGKGFLAGVVGGLVAVGVKMLVDGKIAPKRRQIEDDYAEAAVNAAEAFTHIDLTEEEEDIAETFVEFGMGALIGGVYGLAVEAVPEVKNMGQDKFLATTQQLALPVLGIAPAAVKDAADDKLEKIAGHVAFGVTLEITRRAIRYYMEEE